MSERIGDWIQTYSGKQWWPHDPRPEDVHPEDFPAIAQVTRFGGSCRLADRPAEVTLPRYTVAQHSCLVYDYVREYGGRYLKCVFDEEQKAALVHDLHEIYPPGDQLAPFIRLKSGDLSPQTQAGIAWLRSVSDDAAHCVRLKLRVLTALPPVVKQADLVLLATERRDLMTTPPELRDHWASLPEPWSQRIEVWSAERAWAEWRDRFTACFGWTP